MLRAPDHLTIVISIQTSPGRVEQIWQEGVELMGLPQEDILFYPTFVAPKHDKSDWQPQMGPIDTDFSEGSFFGGSPSAIAWWSRTFYAYHDHWLSQGMFVGKDQTIYNALFFLFSERMITVWVYDPDSPAHSSHEDSSDFVVRNGFTTSSGSRTRVRATR
ncbi:hypothetical protein B0H34DRAFT_427668 [Crassisporium funariophilum]|nr:hypothetical protein B0H34DRAFT_427668 [Crassisporium funariophilum]